MILIKGYGTDRSWNYQNGAAWKTGRVSEFFPLQKTMHFYSQRKHDTVLGTEIWDRSSHTVISKPGQGRWCRDPRTTVCLQKWYLLGTLTPKRLMKWDSAEPLTLLQHLQWLNAGLPTLQSSEFHPPTELEMHFSLKYFLSPKPNKRNSSNNKKKFRMI